MYGRSGVRSIEGRRWSMLTGLSWRVRHTQVLREEEATEKANALRMGDEEFGHFRRTITYGFEAVKVLLGEVEVIWMFYSRA